MQENQQQIMQENQQQSAINTSEEYSKAVNEAWEVYENEYDRNMAILRISIEYTKNNNTFLHEEFIRMMNDIRENGTTHEGTYKNIKYTLKRNHGCAWLGYIHFPDMSNFREFEDNITIHGGFTYRDERCVGFDCCHVRDVSLMSSMGYMISQNYTNVDERASYKDYNFVINEIHSAIDIYIGLLNGGDSDRGDFNENDENRENDV
jgi:hypothetical protein